MKIKIIRIFLIILSVLLLGYALIRESHRIYSLAEPDEYHDASGDEFTEITTFDGVMLRDGKLYDIYSLTPEMLQEKDCST